MELNRPNFIGKRCGMLEIIAKTGNRITVKCDCGNSKEMFMTNFREGNTISCGCHRRRKAGLTLHPLYGVWRSLIARCTDPSHKSYKDYGQRGITVCKEWIDSYEIFYAWAIASGWAAGLQIDRKINDLGYCPENCRFVTRKVNQRNRRGVIFITYKNERKSLADWCDHFGLNLDYVRFRIQRFGFTLEYFVNKLNAA